MIKKTKYFVDIYSDKLINGEPIPLYLFETKDEKMYKVLEKLKDRLSETGVKVRTGMITYER